MNLDVLPRDTTPDAFRVYLEALRAMSEEDRLRLVFRLSRRLRSLTEAGVRYRHPDYSDQEVQLASTQVRLGDALFRQVFPSANIRP